MSQKTEFCRNCAKEVYLGQLSNRGYCQACAQERLNDAVRQMRDKSGPLYEKWRVNYIAAMAGVVSRLADECEESD